MVRRRAGVKSLVQLGSLTCEVRAHASLEHLLALFLLTRAGLSCFPANATQGVLAYLSGKHGLSLASGAHTDSEWDRNPPT